MLGYLTTQRWKSLNPIRVLARFTTDKNNTGGFRESWCVMHARLKVSIEMQLYNLPENKSYSLIHGPLTSYANLRVAHAPGIPGTCSPPQRVSDPDMHYGTCVYYFIHGGAFPAFPIPGACATRNITYLLSGSYRWYISILVVSAHVALQLYGSSVVY